MRQGQPPEASAETIHDRPIDPLLTVHEVAAILRYHPSTVRLKARKGLIPCVRLGQALRFHTSDIQRFIAGAKTPPLSEDKPC